MIFSQPILLCSNNRDTTLDMAKGLLIILVVLGHAIQYSFGIEYTKSGDFFSNIVFKSIYSFHMPLFMLISGYLFHNSNKKDFKPLMVSKLIAIGIPMISFIILCNFYTEIKYLRDYDFTGLFLYIIDQVYRGGTMWFLFSLLLNMTVISIITRSIRNIKLQYLLILVVFILTMLIPDTILLSSHKYMFPFFCMGYIIKEKKIKLYNRTNNQITLIVLTLLSIISISWFDTDTYIYTTGFCIVNDCMGHLYLNTKRIVIALITSYTFMQYVHIWSNLIKSVTHVLLIRLGQISLFVYGFNVFFDTIYTRVLFLLHINWDFNYTIPFLFTIFTIILATSLYNVFDRSKITRIILLGK